MIGSRKKPRKNREQREQIAFFEALEKYYPAIYALTTAIENGGYRTEIQGYLLKKAGLKPGIPDIFCFFPTAGYHGLFIEMKAPSILGGSKGVVSPRQKIVHNLLRSQNYKVEVCYTAAEALETIIGYWNLTTS